MTIGTITVALSTDTALLIAELTGALNRVADTIQKFGANGPLAARKVTGDAAAPIPPTNSAREQNHRPFSPGSSARETATGQLRAEAPTVDVPSLAGSTRPTPAAPDVTNPGAAAFPMKLVVTVPKTPKKPPFVMFRTSEQGPRA